MSANNDSSLDLTFSAGKLGETQLGDLSYFTSLDQTIYLNHAAISPPSHSVKREVLRVLEMFSHLGSGAFLELVEERLELKKRLARLLSAPSESGADFAWVSNTTSGVQAVAHAFPWSTGDRIVLFEGEFPTNVIPWVQIAKRHDLEVVWASLDPLAKRDAPDLSPLESILRSGVRLLAISAVQFQTGLRAPLEEIAELCERYHTALFIDGIQACGAVPIPLDRVDFLSSGGHKWMMGVEGGGFLYIHPRWQERLITAQAGWLSVQDPLDFLFAPESCLSYHKEVRAEVSAFEGGAQSAICYAALGASITALESFGVDVIYEYIQSLLNPLEAGLIARGFTSARLSDTARRSCILSVRPPTPTSPSAPRDISEWARALQDQHVVASTPDGWLRFSPHWPNNLSQIERTLEVIDQVLKPC